MRRLFSLFVLVLFAAGASAASLTEQQKITALLDAISDSGATFIRNGETHDAAYARKHHEEKLSHTKDVNTAGDFITKVASTSVHTGKPYLFQLKDGTKIEYGEWLRKKLSEIEK